MIPACHSPVQADHLTKLNNLSRYVLGSSYRYHHIRPYTGPNHFISDKFWLSTHLVGIFASCSSFGAFLGFAITWVTWF